MPGAWLKIEQRISNVAVITFNKKCDGVTNCTTKKIYKSKLRTTLMYIVHNIFFLGKRYEFQDDSRRFRVKSFNNLLFVQIGTLKGHFLFFFQ